MNNLTTDQPDLAAYLLLEGYDLVHVFIDSNVTKFIFDYDDCITETARRFINNELYIFPKEYFESIKKLAGIVKDILRVDIL